MDGRNYLRMVMVILITRPSIIHVNHVVCMIVFEPAIMRIGVLRTPMPLHLVPRRILRLGHVQHGGIVEVDGSALASVLRPD